MTPGLGMTWTSEPAPLAGVLVGSIVWTLDDRVNQHLPRGAVELLAGDLSLDQEPAAGLDGPVAGKPESTACAARRSPSESGTEGAGSMRTCQSMMRDDSRAQNVKTKPAEEVHCQMLNLARERGWIQDGCPGAGSPGSKSAVKRSAGAGLFPPRANRGFVVGHQGVLEGIEAILQGAEGLEHGPAVFAEDGSPELGIGGRDAGAVAIGAGGQRQPLAGDRSGQCRSDERGASDWCKRGSRRVQPVTFRRRGSRGQVQSASVSRVRSSGVLGVGVMMQTRSSKRSARACAGPRRSEPASG